MRTVQNGEITMSRYLRLLSILLLFLPFWGNSLFAQSKSLKPGLRLGLASSSMNEDLLAGDLPAGDLAINVDRIRRLAFNPGVFVEYRLSGSFALQLNAIYNHKGVKVESTVEGTIFEPSLGQNVNVFIRTQQTLNLAYLSFPLLGKFLFGGKTPGTTRPFITAGPEVGVLLSAKTGNLTGDVQAYLPGQGGGAVDLEAPGEDIKDNIESLEYVFNVGAGAIFPVGNTEILLEGWYGLGLSKINKTGDSSIKNNAVSLNLGLMF